MIQAKGTEQSSTCSGGVQSECTHVKQQQAEIERASSHALASSSIPITIEGWMEASRALTSRSSLLRSTVELAWMLTSHLCQISNSFSGAEVQLEDHIKTDNIIIHVRRELPHGIDQVLTITDAEFKSLLPDGTSPKSCTRSSSYPHSHAVCVALGRLLLEIFSGGRASSVSPGISADILAKHGNYTQNNQKDQYFPPPKSKRQATAREFPSDSICRRTAWDSLISLGMPSSICQLVGDLVEAENTTRYNPTFACLEDILDTGSGNESHSKICPLLSINEALLDLSRMKTFPNLFLFDRTCPQKALDDTCLFYNTDAHLIGREDEMSALMVAKRNVSVHVYTESISNVDSNFLCETMFLNGYAGSGKSSLLHSLTRSCDEDRWFVLSCKFGQQSSPHMILAKAFNDFFAKWGAASSATSDFTPTMIQSFKTFCGCIFAEMDDEGLKQLCDIVPNFAQFFPKVKLWSNNEHQSGMPSMDKAGSGKKRLERLFHVLIKTLCSAGCPVLFALDDLQWSKFAIDIVIDFVVNYVHDMQQGSDSARRRGLMIIGTYRSNEVGDLNNKISRMKECKRANVSLITIGELSKVDVLELVSSKLCLPWRYTRELAEIVQKKTRGNAFFVLQFLRSIIRNGMLVFSVKSRQWIWDCDVVDMQMISDGVAHLLSTTLIQLPSALMQTLQVFSCLGTQVEESTIDALDLGNEILLFNMQNQLPLAVTEGILEKAGPVYQFTHDIVHQTIYELIPPFDRKWLHKKIGKKLLKSAWKDPSIHTLGTDQINTFCKDGFPSREERPLFAKSNAEAAKFAISASNFDQARSYVDVGIQLLDEQHWERQYSLSLDLFEMSASVFWIHGKLPKMARCLDEIISHAKILDDTLKTSSLLVKLLATSSKFSEAEENCLNVLRNLGEEFPSDYDLTFVLSELSSMKTTLNHITTNIKQQLPTMTDRTKLNAMKFLNILCMYGFNSKPILLPILSCRMIKLTMDYGFCDDSIVGLATIGLAVFHYTEDVHLASHLSRVCEFLIEESPNKHVLRSRLCYELMSGLKWITERAQSVRSLLPELYNSAMMAGDVENAMINKWNYHGVQFWTGATGLCHLAERLVMCIKEAIKYQQNTVVHTAMATWNACAYLSGATNADMDLKSLDELDQIGLKTNSQFLLWQTFMFRLALHFWMREYLDVAQLSEAYSEKNPSSPKNRILNIFRNLFEGIAYFNLARDTREVKWKALGEKTVMWMSQMESMSRWNFENKLKLLQAEHYYLKGDLELADFFYNASIKSAGAHGFANEEALALELHGVFCIENQMIDKGLNQLSLALEKYELWKATKKANELQLFMAQFTTSVEIIQ